MDLLPRKARYFISGLSELKKLTSELMPPGDIPSMSQADVETAVKKVNPAAAPTSGQLLEIHGEPYLLGIDRRNGDCSEITVWPDQPSSPANKKSPTTGPKPIYKALVCG